jgi:hypothetical protein
MSCRISIVLCICRKCSRFHSEIVDALIHIKAASPDPSEMASDRKAVAFPDHYVRTRISIGILSLKNEVRFRFDH